MTVFIIILTLAAIVLTVFRYNIRYGKFHATDNEIEEAAKNAEIHRSIMEFPNKYNSVVSIFILEQVKILPCCKYFYFGASKDSACRQKSTAQLSYPKQF